MVILRNSTTEAGFPQRIDAIPSRDVLTALHRISLAQTHFSGRSRHSRGETIPPDIGMGLTRMVGIVGYDISSEIQVANGGKEEAIKNVLSVLRLLFYSDLTKYADEPIHIS